MTEEVESFDNFIIDKKPKRKRHEEVDEQALEQIVFGRESDVLKSIKKSKNNSNEINEEIDRSESESDEDIDEESDGSEEDIEDRIVANESLRSDFLKSQTLKTSVWTDADDDIKVSEALKSANTKPRRVATDKAYKEYLENKFNDLYKTPKWAQKVSKKRSKDEENSESYSSDDESGDELMRTAQNFKRQSKGVEKGILAIKKCTNLTNDFKIKAVLNCVEFHPTSTVALVSSPNGSVHLFQVDGKINAKIESIKFKDFRIEIAKFINSGRELIVGSKRESGYYFYYDMIAAKMIKIPFIKGTEKYTLEKFVVSSDEKYMASKGKNGFINILTAKTKEHIFDLKMNGEVMSLAFTADPNQLLTHGSVDKVCIWDIRQRRCINRFTDEGCITGTSIAVSPDSQYCVTGSDMGIVNVYNFNDVLTKSEPKPLKSIMNLTTEITTLKFNHSSDLLMMSSNAKDNSIRCLHMKSLSVFHNFPFVRKNYGRIHDIDISVNSGYLSFANNFGTAHLFRLTNFDNY